MAAPPRPAPPHLPWIAHKPVTRLGPNHSRPPWSLGTQAALPDFADYNVLDECHPASLPGGPLLACLGVKLQWLGVGWGGGWGVGGGTRDPGWAVLIGELIGWAPPGPQPGMVVGGRVRDGWVGTVGQ